VTDLRRIEIAFPDFSLPKINNWSEKERDYLEKRSKEVGNNMVTPQSDKIRSIAPKLDCGQIKVTTSKNPKRNALSV